MSGWPKTSVDLKLNWTGNPVASALGGILGIEKLKASHAFVCTESYFYPGL